MPTARRIALMAAALLTGVTFVPASPLASAGSAVNQFGMHGVLEVPSARMPREAELTASVSRQDVADIYSIAYQPLPWLEVGYRYTIFDPRCEGSDRRCDGLRDRSFEVKARLLSETRWRPQVAVGLRDIAGTGAWGAEYVAASKRIGNLDLTLGVGWGRLAERAVAENPLIRISERFAQRDSEFGLGGTLSWGDYFAGPDVGAFGALRYSIPRWKLDLLAAYNSDTYAREQAIGSTRAPDPMSYGIEWEFRRGMRLGATWSGRRELGLQFSAAFDTARPATRKPPNGFGVRGFDNAPAVAPEPPLDWWQRMTYDAQSSGVLLYSASQQTPDSLQIRYGNRAYQNEADAVGRVLTLAQQHAPPGVDRILLSGETAGFDTHSVEYRRPPRARGEALASLAPPGGVAPPADTPAPAFDIGPPRNFVDPDRVNLFTYPNGMLSFNVGARAYLFDPDLPFLYELFARANADADLGRGFSVHGSYVQRLHSQFDRIQRVSDSQLPRVRSDSAEYLKQGDSRVDRLALVHRATLAPGLYYQSFAGWLEEMYAGAGVELLYRPHGSRFAVGGNVIAARQREFDGGLGLRDYQTVTGHLSVYWASPWHDLDFAIHAGRYLARDVGATLEIQKRFSNGWSVGAFATLTDVPFSQFGEGSFDKGLMFRIPIDSLARSNTRSAYRTILRSIQRDGGQRLESWGTGLWEDLRGSHPVWLEQDRERMVPP
jgi:hypothetical protein